MQAGDLSGLLHVAHAHGVGASRLGDQDPDQATIVQVRHGIHKDIRKVLLLGVIRAPPDDRAF